MNEDTKKLTQSKTFWGVFLLWVTTLLEGYGIKVEEITSGTVTTSAIVTALSAVALWGRIKAEDKIDRLL